MDGQVERYIVKILGAQLAQFAQQYCPTIGSFAISMGSPADLTIIFWRQLQS
jgi:hypothetical protein